MMVCRSRMLRDATYQHVFICNKIRECPRVCRWNFWNIHSNNQKSVLGDVENVSAFGQIWVEYNLEWRDWTIPYNRNIKSSEYLFTLLNVYEISGPNVLWCRCSQCAVQYCFVVLQTVGQMRFPIGKIDFYHIQNLSGWYNNKKRLCA